MGVISHSYPALTRVLDTSAEFVLFGYDEIVAITGLGGFLFIVYSLLVIPVLAKSRSNIGFKFLLVALASFGACAMSLMFSSSPSVSPEFAEHLSVEEVDFVLADEVGTPREVEEMEYDSAEETYSGVYVLSNNEAFESDYYDVTVDLDGTVEIQTADYPESVESDGEES